MPLSWHQDTGLYSAIVINKRKTITLVIGRWLCFHAISPRNEAQGRAHKAERNETFTFRLEVLPRFKNAPQGVSPCSASNNIYIIGRSIYSKLGQGRVARLVHVRSSSRLVMHADDDNAIALPRTRADAICIGSVAWPICAAHISVQLVVGRLLSSFFFLPFRNETFYSPRTGESSRMRKNRQSAVCISVGGGRGNC